MSRKATAIWKGSGKEGTGTLSTQSTVLEDAQYSYKSRFEDGKGTNPEELMAAAHAGCFSMKLSFVLDSYGFTPEELNTECSITLKDGVISKSALVLKAKIPGISEEQFKAAADDAKANCPVSKAYNMEITLDAQLV